MSQNQTGGVSPEGIPMADNKTDSRQWTSEKPTKSGSYYYRQSDDEDFKVDVCDALEQGLRVETIWWYLTVANQKMILSPHLLISFFMHRHAKPFPVERSSELSR